MAAYSLWLSLAGYALGVLGAGLVFIEFFQLPSYVQYQKSMGNYNVMLSPDDAREYSWAGRIGALLIALAFAFQFVATLIG